MRQRRLPANLRRPKPTGFTLIELLVVIAIIAVLIALLLPAVQQAREAARRTQCKNNLMQVSLALQNYMMAHEVLPPGTVNWDGPIRNRPQGYHFSWLVRILPYLEQRNVYSHFKFDRSVYDPANLPARQARIATFLCPSSAISTGVDQLPLSNYAGCHNDVEAPIAADNAGVLFLNSAVTYEMISDGSSNTIYIGEKQAEQNDLGWASGTRATLRNTGTRINEIITAASAPIGEPAAEGEVPEEEFSVGGSAGAEPQTPAGGTPAGSLRVGGFGGAHVGGANFAMGDSSVRFISENIDPKLYHNLANRADGEMLGDF